MSISLISLNVNGIRDKEKRLTLFKWLQEKNTDLCLLQETHGECIEDVNMWCNEWGGTIYSAFGSNMSRGVAIMFKPKLALDHKVIETDVEGRFLILELSVDEKKYVVINIYAPNNRRQRELFFKKSKNM